LTTSPGFTGDFRLLTSPNEVLRINEELKKRLGLDYELYKILQSISNGHWADHLMGRIRWLISDGYVERTMDGFVLTCYGQNILNAAEHVISRLKVTSINSKKRARGA
jgi:hypothetical protein